MEHLQLYLVHVKKGWWLIIKWRGELYLIERSTSNLKFSWGRINLKIGYKNSSENLQFCSELQRHGCTLIRKNPVKEFSNSCVPYAEGWTSENQICLSIQAKEWTDQIPSKCWGCSNLMYLLRQTDYWVYFPLILPLSGHIWNRKFFEKLFLKSRIGTRHNSIQLFFSTLGI